MTRLNRIVPAIFAAAGALLLAGCGGPNLFDRLGGFWGNGICWGIIVVLDILALVEIAGTDWTLGRKVLWALVIVFMPLIGLALYWFLAREKGA